MGVGLIRRLTSESPSSASPSPSPSFPRRRESRVVPLVAALAHCLRLRRVFGPAADPLWYLHNFASQSEQLPASRTCVDKKVGKEATPASSALAARGLPCAARSLRPRQTHFVRCAHCVQTSGAKSVFDARCRARRKALCCSARPKGETNASRPRFASAHSPPSFRRRRESTICRHAGFPTARE